MRGSFQLLPRDPQIGWTPFAWLIYLVPFVIAPFAANASTFHRATAVVAAAVFLALYFAGFWIRGWRLLSIIAGIVVIGCVFLPTHPGAAVFFIYAGSFAPWVTGRTRTVVAIIAAVTAVLIVEALVADVPLTLWLWGVVFTILIGALNIHHAQTLRMNKKLRMAQHEIEHLAKVAERERIARDLHDVVGHTLSLIVLKSELASKLANRDPARAAAEIRDVERVARDALAQVRSAISGYRSAGLDRELQDVRDVLTSAGMAIEITRDATTFSASEEAVLSLAIREAVTNVLRHSRASRCEIRVNEGTDGSRRVEVVDNGTGMNGQSGFGLQGMRERVGAIGGALRVTSDRGTHLSITLPAVSSERVS